MPSALRRRAIGRWLTWGSSAGFLATAALHASGYPSVLEASEEVPGSFGALVPMLWLVFSSDLAILGLIVGVLAWRPSVVARPVLALAALCPLVVAAMQLSSIGFMPPTALLLGLGVLTLVSAAVSGPASSPGDAHSPVPPRRADRKR